MFIAYYLGGGYFPEKEVTLQVINATFEYPVVLAWIAWLAFIWFIYRYWLKNKGQLKSRFFSELGSIQDRKYVQKYVDDVTDESAVKTGQGFHVTSVQYGKRVGGSEASNGYFLSTQYASNVIRGGDGRNFAKSNPEDTFLKNPAAPRLCVSFYNSRAQPGRNLIDDGI